MIISIEVPVFKGQFLQKCIDSVLNQTSTAWELSLVWDGGDDLSKEILEKLNAANHPNVKIYFTENQGIARARAFLSDKNKNAYILPLDDDDELAVNAVEVFIKAAHLYPWASLIRGQRGFINEQSEIVNEQQWFPFGHRQYFKGMVTDIFNQSQPYLIRRTAYEQTLGWRGFDDYLQAGEDCDIFLQLEEVAHFELINDLLYYYRLHDDRASNQLTSAAAFEMWRRLTDDTIRRIGFNLVRTNEVPPFSFDVKESVKKSIVNVDFVVEQNTDLVKLLKSFGINDSSIIEVGSDCNGAWRMNGFKASQKDLICFIDHSVIFNDIGSVIELVSVLQQSEADILSLAIEAGESTIKESFIKQCSWLTDKCLMVKREVLLATGGFDHNYIPEDLQIIDFCIQAHRRKFTCYEVNIPGVSYSETPKRYWSEDELIPIKSKWVNHSFLLSSINDLINFSGD